MNLITLDERTWDNLADKAWAAREHAFLFGKTSVGAALLSEKGNIYIGCNVEHKYRCHDIHAEVNAISNMVSSGEITFSVIFIAAERKQFTPCGSCMDWIMQHGGANCIVAYQENKNSEIVKFLATELMPHYPS